MDLARLRVEVVAALPDRQWVVGLELPAGATVQDALDAADLSGLWPDWRTAAAGIGIFGRPCQPDRLLQAGDRVEIYRALKADPKEVRRQLADLERSRRRSGTLD